MADKPLFSCILPFYNEGLQTLSVIGSLRNVSQINQIVAVDDGSTDNASVQISYKQPAVKLIILPVNKGKTTAIKRGIKNATNEHILLIDADYKDLESKKISEVLNVYFDNQLDMLLVKVGGGNNAIDRLMKKEVLLTGFRVLRKSDLDSVLKQGFSGYQLEVAVNRYMILNNKKVGWVDSKVKNVHKSIKWGFANGLFKSIKMELSILSYLGAFGLLRQYSYFSKKQLH